MLLTDNNDVTMFRRVRKIFKNTKNLGEMKFWEECGLENKCPKAQSCKV
jgi:hypothetical protein